MPPVALALAPLAGSMLGSAVLPALAGETLLGIGTGTLGGILGGAATGAATSEDPLVGALTGGVSGGLAGPGLAEGAGSLLSGAGDLLGIGAEAAATAATPGVPAAGTAGLPGTAQALSPTGTLAEVSGVGGQGVGTGVGSPTLGGTFSTETPAGQALNAATGDIGAVGDVAAPPPTSGTTPAAGTAPKGDWLTRNKDWLLPATGIAASALQQGSQLEGLERIAAQNMTRARGLMAGHVPAGIQAGIDSAKEAAKARVVSMLSSAGMSPTSTPTMQAVANIEQAAAVHGANLARELVERGLTENQLATTLYLDLLKLAMGQDDRLGKAIGKFSASLAA